MKINSLATKALPASIQKRIDKLAVKAATSWLEAARGCLTAQMMPTVGLLDWQIDQKMARLESAALPIFRGWPVTATARILKANEATTFRFKGETLRFKAGTLISREKKTA